MSEHTRVDEFLTSLLAICKPLEPFEMPLLDAHGATLAEDIYAGERLVLRSGTRIRSTQIGLAASIGRDHLPTRPHPRVVVLSAGPDLVEPGQPLKNASDEYETNSWLLTTAVREVGAVAYREDQVMKLQPTCETLISIGWKPIVSFDSGIAQTIAWLKGQSADELVCLNGEKTTFELPARR